MSQAIRVFDARICLKEDGRTQPLVFSPFLSGLEKEITVTDEQVFLRVPVGISERDVRLVLQHGLFHPPLSCRMASL